MNEKIYSLKAFSGLCENPDGDTKLSFGQASVCKNFAVTRDGNLRRRAGSKTLIKLGSAPVRGIWQGLVKGEDELICACDGNIWRLSEEENGVFSMQNLGAMNTDREVHFFPFSNLLYMINGIEYKVFDGKSLKNVDGYRPLVAVTVPPAGGGETLERVNRLSGCRRLWLSPDGKGTEFKLPEENILSLDYVKDLKTGALLDKSLYSADLAQGKIIFSSPPAQAVNSIEAGWTMKKNYRQDVLSMRFGELYNGTQDSRIFLYGDGSNRCIYSDLDYDGNPRADYFPDLNELRVGDENSPVTGLIRHYSSLICFKSHSAWSIRYGNIELKDKTVTAAFYCSPINRSIGNEAMGQQKLVLNSPRSLHGRDLFEWRNASAYSSGVTQDERQAKRISDRIFKTLGEFDFSKCICFDDNVAQEYYISCGNSCLVQNYACDAWYLYEGLNATAFQNYRGELIFGTADGEIKSLSYRWKSDDGKAIKAYWESGAMSFGLDSRRKYSCMLWVGIKPESFGELHVSIQTDRRSRYGDKKIVSSIASFCPADFSRWSFKTNRKPQIHRLKLKAKKFVYYKLIFESRSPNTAATVLASDLRLRLTGWAK